MTAPDRDVHKARTVGLQGEIHMQRQIQDVVAQPSPSLTQQQHFQGWMDKESTT